MADTPALLESLGRVLRDAGVDASGWVLAWARSIPSLLLVPALGPPGLPLPLRLVFAAVLAVVIAPTLAGLPPAFVLTAECDPLRDQGEAYARRLEAAGVRVTHTRYAGMFHPFFSLAGIIDGGRAAMSDAAQALADAAQLPERDEQPV